jgi:DNA-directed RNA polymerase subunit RPC12/RpoP
MLSQHYLISGPSKEASSSTTLTTTTGRRDEYSQGVTKDTPTTRELLRSRPNWRRRLNLLLIAVSLLLGTVAAASSKWEVQIEHEGRPTRVQLPQEVQDQLNSVKTYVLPARSTKYGYLFGGYKRESEKYYCLNRPECGKRVSPGPDGDQTQCPHCSQKGISNVEKYNIYFDPKKQTDLAASFDKDGKFHQVPHFDDTPFFQLNLRTKGPRPIYAPANWRTSGPRPAHAPEKP